MLPMLAETAATTGYDVLDDIVKIGLGALIGAAVGVYSLWRTHKHEFDRVLFQRRQEIIFKAADDFEAVHALVRDPMLDYPMLLLKVANLGGPTVQAARLAVGATADPVGRCSRQIQYVEAKLLLINQVSTAKLVAQYRLLMPDCQRILSSAATATPRSIEDANAIRKKLFDQRKAIYADLAKIYGSPHGVVDSSSDDGT